MKKFYKIIAKILIVALLFVNQGMMTFADSVETTVEESTIEETTEENVDMTEKYVPDEVLEGEPEEAEEDIIEEPEEVYEEEPEDDSVEEFEEEPKEDFVEELEEEPVEDSSEEVGEENEEIEIATDSEVEEGENIEEGVEEETEVATSSETFETDDTVVASDSEAEENVEEVVVDENDPLGLVATNLFGGTVDVNETIYLDFGHTPRFEKTKSDNWSKTEAATAIDVWNEDIDTNGNYKYDITGNVGTLITAKFADTNPPIQNTGAGDHVRLPAFDEGDGTVWPGFKFVGWLDKDGQNLKFSQNGNFKYAFQYGTGTPSETPNDTYYTASWQQLETTQTLEIHYMRSTASTPTIENAYEFFNPVIYNDKKHSKFLYEGIKNVPGYKPTSYIITDDAGNVIPDEVDGVTIQGRGLKTLDVYGKYFEYDPVNDLKVNSEWALDGNMPNHNIKIYFFYEPDENGKSVFEVSHQSTSGTELGGSSSTTPTLAEAIISAGPQEIDHYTYKYVTVSTVAGSKATGIYALGQAEFSLPDQILNPSDNPSLTPPPYPADMGKFYAKMPNQDVKITYYYEMSDGYDDIVFNVGKEQADGSIATESTTITDVHVSSTDRYTYTIHNLENLGYGAPVITPYDVATEPFDYHAGIGQPDSTLTYYIPDFGDCRVDITYYYDYTSRYWTKVNFNAKSRADGGHGEINALPGTKVLDKRFFKRGGVEVTEPVTTYTIAELTTGVDASADTYYLTKWYECSSSLEPIGSPLNMTDTVSFDVDKIQYGLYAAFEEDPAWWRDINYESAPNCTLDGISSTHVTKDVLKVNVASPSVIAAAGYKWDGAICVDSTARKYEGGIWLDEGGNPMPANLIDVLGVDGVLSKNYHPSIVVDANPYPGAVRPVSSLFIGTDGKGMARPFGLYSERYYVLADASDKVIESRPGIGFPIGGFENLMPGHSYHIYEVKNQADVPAVGSSIEPVGSGESATISDYYEVNIPAISNTPIVSVDGKTITISGLSGIEYALLKTDRTIAKNFGEAFTNLDEAPYYIVVARSTGETLSATDTKLIKNGVPVYTGAHDLTGREYKLVVLGSGVSVTGKSGTSASVGTGKVYKITAGTDVELSGVSGNEWEVITNNANLTSFTSIKPHLTMPNEDVVVRNYSPINSVSEHYSVSMSGSSGVGLADKETLATYLQTDTNATDKAAQGLNVFHNIVLKKTCALSDISGKFTPYEYSFDVGMTIQGSPYPYTTVDPLSDANKLKSFISYDKGLLGNEGYAINSGSITKILDSETDEKIMGSGMITLETAKTFGYKQIQKVVVKSSTDASFNKTLYVDYNALLNTASNYSEISPRLVDYWVPDTPSAGTTFNDIKYLYDRTATDDASATTIDVASANIKRDYNLKIYHNIDQVREDNKILLRDELNAADTKLGTLTSAIAIASLTNAINTATYVKDHQREKTPEEIYDAYITLKTAVDNAFDPPLPPGTAITIAINGNGGTANVTEVVVTVGATYSELSTITVSRDGYTFARWNSSADGSGININSSMIVDSTTAPTTLYAIWNQNYTPVIRINTGGGSSGGGGGGRGGNSITPGRGAQLQLNPLTGTTEFTKMMSNNSGLGARFTNAILLVKGSNCTTGYENTNFCIYNTDGSKVKNQWVAVWESVPGIENGVTHTYRVDENGNAITGFYTEGNEVYYLSKSVGANYASLQVGWIYDVDNNSFYYCSPHTGAVITGWLNIDGKDYYFADNKAFDLAGKLNINNDTVKTSGYGKMLSNCMTPDGFMLDANGARIIYKP